MAKDRFGYGYPEYYSRLPRHAQIFIEKMAEVGIDPNSSQQELFDIYNNAKKTGDKKKFKVLNEYIDSWT